MAFGDMNQPGFNNFNSKRQTGRVQNVQAINKNPPMVPQFSSFYGNMNAGGVSARQAQAMRQQQLAQMQMQPPVIPTMGSAQQFYQQPTLPPPPPPVNMMPIQSNPADQLEGYRLQSYNDYIARTGGNAPSQQFYQQPNAPIPQDLYRSIGTYGSAFKIQNPTPPPIPTQPITAAGSPVIGQTLTPPVPPTVVKSGRTGGSSSNIPANISPDDIAFYRSLYMTMKPSDVNYAQALTPTKYGGTFGDSYGAGFDKWFEENYLKNSSFSNRK